MKFKTPVWLTDSTTGCLRFEGKDVHKYLQTKLTRNVKRWEPGHAYYALAVNINGQVLFDGEFLCLNEHTVDAWISTDRLAAASSHLEKYVILEDVTITEKPLVSWICYADSASDLKAEWASLDLPELDAPLAGGGLYAYQRPRSIAPSARLVAPAAENAPLQTLIDARPAIDAATIEREEILRGFPRLGRDVLVDKTIPLEAGLFDGVDFNKGCYLGQEVIERLHSRGTPARRLVRVRWSGEGAAPGTEIQVDGKNAGWLTSSVPVDDEHVGLAYVRRKFLDGAEPLRFSEGSSPVEILGVVGDD